MAEAEKLLKTTLKLTTMEIAFTLSMILLILFALLGLYDGFYLHIFKYALHNHLESRTEHIMHTLRAILFPAILYFLYLKNDSMSFYIGISLVLIDILILGIDAFVEKDSRAFMGGLPRWEYIIHLFVNGFHFAAIAVFLVIKLQVGEIDLQLRTDFTSVSNYTSFIWLVKNLIPGGIFMAFLHLFVLFPKTEQYWFRLRNKITCC
jgi:uncharacterized membrane protein